MTIHPDSLKKGSPSSYYCTQCKYRHNRGSIRYHEHWAWRTETPEVLKRSKPAKQAGFTDPVFLIGVLFLLLGITVALWGIYSKLKRDSSPVSNAARIMSYTPDDMYVWHDDLREVTCYVYIGGLGVSCVPDTKKMLWIAQNPEGVPPQ